MGRVILSGRRFAKRALIASVFVFNEDYFENCYQTQTLGFPLCLSDDCRLKCDEAGTVIAYPPSALMIGFQIIFLIRVLCEIKITAVTIITGKLLRTHAMLYLKHHN